MSALYECGSFQFRTTNQKRLMSKQQYREHPTETGKTSVPSSMAAGCICLVCNEYREDMTHSHAQSHGYSSREEMLKDGKIKYLNRAKQDRMIRKFA